MHENGKRFWLVKFAPFRTSWIDIIRHGAFTLRGVRSSLARKNLKQMKIGDLVLFYQSQQQQAILGIMGVTREAYPDPTSCDPQWLTCNFVPIKTLQRPVTLAEIKSLSCLASIDLIRQPRLAVMPVSIDHFRLITEDLCMLTKN